MTAQTQQLLSFKSSGRWMGESPLQYLANAEEIDIKIAQGVKPGDGKSTRLIFSVR